MTPKELVIFYQAIADGEKGKARTRTSWAPIVNGPNLTSNKENFCIKLKPIERWLNIYQGCENKGGVYVNESDARAFVSEGGKTIKMREVEE